MQVIILDQGSSKNIERLPTDTWPATQNAHAYSFLLTTAPCCP